MVCALLAEGVFRHSSAAIGGEETENKTGGGGCRFLYKWFISLLLTAISRAVKSR
jgi:hypothetical protein